jgi:hypothetical protein
MWGQATLLRRCMFLNAALSASIAHFNRARSPCIAIHCPASFLFILYRSHQTCRRISNTTHTPRGITAQQRAWHAQSCELSLLLVPRGTVQKIHLEHDENRSGVSKYDDMLYSLSDSLSECRCVCLCRACALGNFISDSSMICIYIYII